VEDGGELPILIFDVGERLEGKNWNTGIMEEWNDGEGRGEEGEDWNVGMVEWWAAGRALWIYDLRFMICDCGSSLWPSVVSVAKGGCQIPVHSCQFAVRLPRGLAMT